MNLQFTGRFKKVMNLFYWLLGTGFILLIAPGASCEKESGNPVDQKSIEVSVMSMGAVGNGTADDTKAFQKTIDYVAEKGGGTVVVPRGKYLIDADTTVRIKSHVTLRMDAAAELIAKPTASQRSYILMVLNATDVNIIGGRIIGDRDVHLDSTGEWGMGIAVYSGTNVTINGTKIYNCWGDGIVIGSKGSAPYLSFDASRNVIVKNVTSDNNRRQGITVGKANQVLIDSCIFTNTHGTKPMAGIDIEPDKDTAQNITITNSEFAFNKGNGIEIFANKRSVVRNVVIHNNFVHHNTYGGYLIRANNVDFTNNRIIQNKYKPPVKAVDTVNCVLTPNAYQ